MTRRAGPPSRARLARVVLAVSCATTPTLASGALETIGAPGAGNGFTARVMSRGPEVTYYNPSLLPETTSDFALGFQVLAQWHHIDLAPRPSGVDVPDSVYDADLVHSGMPAGQFWPQATSRLPHGRTDTVTKDATPYLALGLVRPLLSEGRLVLGFYALVPATGFLQQDPFFPDEREQYFSNQLHFELLGDRLRVPTVAASLGSRLSRHLSLGVGVDLGMGTRARTEVYIPNAVDQRTLLIAPETDTTLSAAPFLALTLHPFAEWLLTATLHAGRSWNTSGENRVHFWDYTYPAGENAIVQAYALSQGDEPLRVALGTGTGGTVGATEWRLGLQGEWTRWSRYRDRQDQRPENAWHDTVNVGVGWVLERSHHELMAELGVAPSPVPEQTGRTNYVDNTRWGASVGGSVPFRCFATDYALGLYLQGQVLLLRMTEKRADAPSPVRDELPDGAVDRVRGDPLAGAAGLQTNNPGYPGYTSYGTMLGASLVLKARR